MVIDRCKKELQTTISTIEVSTTGIVDYLLLTCMIGQVECPILARRDASAGFILSGTIGILRILKEAADIAPVPFLKGTIGTVLILLESAKVCSSAAID